MICHLKYLSDNCYTDRRALVVQGSKLVREETPSQSSPALARVAMLPASAPLDGGPTASSMANENSLEARASARQNCSASPVTASAPAALFTWLCALLSLTSVCPLHRVHRVPNRPQQTGAAVLAIRLLARRRHAHLVPTISLIMRATALLARLDVCCTSCSCSTCLSPLRLSLLLPLPLLLPCLCFCLFLPPAITPDHSIPPWPSCPTNRTRRRPRRGRRCNGKWFYVCRRSWRSRCCEPSSLLIPCLSALCSPPLHSLLLPP